MSRRRKAVIVFNISKQNLDIAHNLVSLWCSECKTFVQIKPKQISGKIFHVTPDEWVPHRTLLHS